jgi:hypothetical protein
MDTSHALRLRCTALAMMLDQFLERLQAPYEEEECGTDYQESSRAD